MKAELYLVRHGRDVEGVRGGWAQHGLTEVGISQGQKLAERFRQENFGVDTLISSDLPRAVQTAEIIAPVLGLPFILSANWRETNNGLLAGMPNPEAEQRYPGLFWNMLEMEQEYPGGESPRQFYQRIATAFEKLTHDLETGKIGSRVLIITHGGPIKVVSAIVSGTEWTNRTNSFPTAETSMHHFTLQNSQWSITQLNETNHLSQGMNSELQ